MDFECGEEAWLASTVSKPSHQAIQRISNSAFRFESRKWLMRMVRRECGCSALRQKTSGKHQPLLVDISQGSVGLRLLDASHTYRSAVNWCPVQLGGARERSVGTGSPWEPVDGRKWTGLPTDIMNEPNFAATFRSGLQCKQATAEGGSRHPHLAFFKNSAQAFACDDHFSARGHAA